MSGFIVWELKLMVGILNYFRVKLIILTSILALKLKILVFYFKIDFKLNLLFKLPLY
jgi:hypothetical protein